MKDFIKINETRIKKSVIKKYLPVGDLTINIYFNTSKDRIEVEMFKFANKAKRTHMINFLDTNFL